MRTFLCKLPVGRTFHHHPCEIKCGLPAPDQSHPQAQPILSFDSVFLKQKSMGNDDITVCLTNRFFPVSQESLLLCTARLYVCDRLLTNRAPTTSRIPTIAKIFLPFQIVQQQQLGLPSLILSTRTRYTGSRGRSLFTSNDIHDPNLSFTKPIQMNLLEPQADLPLVLTDRLLHLCRDVLPQ